MLKTRILLIALACCLFFLPAAAESQYPQAQGAVTDLAGVLGVATADDTALLSQRLKDAVDGEIYVVTRHFLGGAEPLEYGQYLFDAWELGEMDCLLLMVIGEEEYALILGNEAGKRLPLESQMTLLANSFRVEYLNREYDEAVGKFLPALSGQLARAAGEKIDVSGLFGKMTAEITPRPSAWNDLWNGMFAQVEEEEESNWEEEMAQEETKTNWRTVIIWGLVIYFLFIRKKKKRRYNFGHPPKGRR
ncbi:MAG: TPM domain-containing protein [Clostridia bacterium]|nr:TPM domain-containing protein [Clostridia bacterium]